MNGKPMFIDGLAFWTPQAPGWEAAAPALRGEPLPARESPARPAPPLLAANERRRAPDSVLLALEVASAAMAGSGHDPASTASVFTSAHGDLAITDALCRTLASDPLLLSPTRFHHSVHNAASGYWAIATGCRAPSTALAAFDTSFAAGLLEAASQCLADHAPVLLAGYDTEACGPLTSVNSSRGLLGVALVLASQRSAATRWQLHLRLQGGAATPPALRSALALSVQHNAMADALPMFEALAQGRSAALALQVSNGLQLEVQLQPMFPRDAG
jgi:hypothetical protein